jgi:hypothetical protein
MFAWHWKGRCRDSIFIACLMQSLNHECFQLHAADADFRAKAGVTRIKKWEIVRRCERR